jgi:hypothetical protein
VDASRTFQVGYIWGWPDPALHRFRSLGDLYKDLRILHLRASGSNLMGAGKRHNKRHKKFVATVLNLPSNLESPLFCNVFRHALTQGRLHSPEICPPLPSCSCPSHDDDGNARLRFFGRRTFLALLIFSGRWL